MQTTDPLRLAGRPQYIGVEGVTRIEDDRALTGSGTYVGDLRLSGMVEVVIVRSPVAHGRLVNVRLDRARSAADTIAAVAAPDLVGVQRFPDFFPYAKPVSL